MVVSVLSMALCGQGWDPVLTISDPQQNISSRFGEKVFIFGDTMAVGAPGGLGVVHLFARNAGGLDQWELCQSIEPEVDQSTEGFGSVGFGTGLAFDGDDLMIGSQVGLWHYRRGFGGLFERVATVLSGIDHPPVNSIALDGLDLALCGGSFLAGISGAVEVYRRTSIESTDWWFVDVKTFNVSNTDQFTCYGKQVLLRNGNVAVSDPCYRLLTMPQLMYGGRAHLYALDAVVGELMDGGAIHDEFMETFSTSMAFDGDTLMVTHLSGSMPWNGYSGVFALTPTAEGGFAMRHYIGAGSSNGLLDMGHSILVVGSCIIVGTEAGVAFMEKNPNVEENWSLIRADELPGSVLALDYSQEWLAAGVPSARIVQLYRTTSTGQREAESRRVLITYPSPANGFVTIVLPEDVSRHGQLRLLDGAGRVVYERSNGGSSGSTRIDRMDGWTGMYFVELMDHDGGVIAVGRVVWM